MLNITGKFKSTTPAQEPDNASADDDDAFYEYDDPSPADNSNSKNQNGNHTPKGGNRSDPAKTYSAVLKSHTGNINDTDSDYSSNRTSVSSLAYSENTNSVYSHSRGLGAGGYNVHNNLNRPDSSQHPTPAAMSAAVAAASTMQTSFMSSSTSSANRNDDRDNEKRVGSLETDTRAVNEAIERELKAMGFTEESIIDALKKYPGDETRCVEFCIGEKDHESSIRSRQEEELRSQQQQNQLSEISMKESGSSSKKNKGQSPLGLMPTVMPTSSPSTAKPGAKEKKKKKGLFGRIFSKSAGKDSDTKKPPPMNPNYKPSAASRKQASKPANNEMTDAEWAAYYQALEDEKREEEESDYDEEADEDDGSSYDDQSDEDGDDYSTELESPYSKAQSSNRGENSPSQQEKHESYKGHEKVSSPDDDVMWDDHLYQDTEKAPRGFSSSDSDYHDRSRFIPNNNLNFSVDESMGSFKDPINRTIQGPGIAQIIAASNAQPLSAADEELTAKISGDSAVDNSPVDVIDANLQGRSLPSTPAPTPAASIAAATVKATPLPDSATAVRRESIKPPQPPPPPRQGHPTPETALSKSSPVPVVSGTSVMVTALENVSPKEGAIGVETSVGVKVNNSVAVGDSNSSPVKAPLGNNGPVRRESVKPPPPPPPPRRASQSGTAATDNIVHGTIISEHEATHSVGNSNQSTPKSAASTGTFTPPPVPPPPPPRGPSAAGSKASSVVNSARGSPTTIPAHESSTTTNVFSTNTAGIAGGVAADVLAAALRESMDPTQILEERGRYLSTENADENNPVSTTGISGDGNRSPVSASRAAEGDLGSDYDDTENGVQCAMAIDDDEDIDDLDAVIAEAEAVHAPVDVDLSQSLSQSLSMSLDAIMLPGSNTAGIADDEQDNGEESEEEVEADEFAGRTQLSSMFPVQRSAYGSFLEAEVNRIMRHGSRPGSNNKDPEYEAAAAVPDTPTSPFSSSGHNESSSSHEKPAPMRRARSNSAGQISEMLNSGGNSRGRMKTESSKMANSTSNSNLNERSSPSAFETMSAVDALMSAVNATPPVPSPRSIQIENKKTDVIAKDNNTSKSDTTNAKISASEPDHSDQTSKNNKSNDNLKNDKKDRVQSVGPISGDSYLARLAQRRTGINYSADSDDDAGNKRKVNLHNKETEEESDGSDEESEVGSKDSIDDQITKEAADYIASTSSHGSNNSSQPTMKSSAESRRNKPPLKELQTSDPLIAKKSPNLVVAGNSTDLMGVDNDNGEKRTKRLSAAFGRDNVIRGESYEEHPTNNNTHHFGGNHGDEIGVRETISLIRPPLNRSKASDSSRDEGSGGSNSATPRSQEVPGIEHSRAPLIPTSNEASHSFMNVPTPASTANSSSASVSSNNTRPRQRPAALQQSYSASEASSSPHAPHQRGITHSPSQSRNPSITGRGGDIVSSSHTGGPLILVNDNYLIAPFSTVPSLPPSMVGTMDQVYRRQFLPYSVIEKPNGMWQGTISLKQTGLDRNEKSPQGSRPDSIVLGFCPTRALCVEMCETLAPPKWISKNETQKCFLCSNKLSMFFNKLHNCRNCGQLVCSQCSEKCWPGSMIPATYHNEELFVRTCHSCYYLMERFADALRRGDLRASMAVYSSGNVNLHTPFSVYKNHAYPIHCAARGGNLELLRWMMEGKKCTTIDEVSKTPLLNSAGLSVIAVAAKHGHGHIVKYLVHVQKCSVQEIKDVSCLQRALHSILQAPGEMPPLLISKKQKGQDDFLSGVGGSDGTFGGPDTPSSRGSNTIDDGEGGFRGPELVRRPNNKALNPAVVGKLRTALDLQLSAVQHHHAGIGNNSGPASNNGLDRNNSRAGGNILSSSTATTSGTSSTIEGGEPRRGPHSSAVLARRHTVNPSSAAAAPPVINGAANTNAPSPNGMSPPVPSPTVTSHTGGQFNGSSSVTSSSTGRSRDNSPPRLNPLNTSAPGSLSRSLPTGPSAAAAQSRARVGGSSISGSSTPASPARMRHPTSTATVVAPAPSVEDAFAAGAVPATLRVQNECSNVANTPVVQATIYNASSNSRQNVAPVAEASAVVVNETVYELIEEMTPEEMADRGVNDFHPRRGGARPVAAIATEVRAVVSTSTPVPAAPATPSTPLMLQVEGSVPSTTATTSTARNRR